MFTYRLVSIFAWSFSTRRKLIDIFTGLARSPLLSILSSTSFEFVSNCTHLMSDVNFFSSEPDLKKKLFTTEKFPYDRIHSPASWQRRLSDVTRTSDNLTCKPADYCQLDHRLYLPALLSTGVVNPNTIVTFYDNKRISTDSLQPHTEHTFPDSCESLTVSIDLQVPTDELMTDYDEVDEHTLVAAPHSQDLSVAETSR